jgi:hypothetical protein
MFRTCLLHLYLLGIMDDLFQTVFSSGDIDAFVDAICNDLLDYNLNIYAEDELGSSG